MSEPSPETTANSAQRAEGALNGNRHSALRVQRDELMNELHQQTTLLLYNTEAPENRAKLRTHLRSLARLFNIPVSGQD